jgi:hypothetical protein
MNKLTLHDELTALYLPQERREEDKHRLLPAFKGDDEWHHISWLLDLNVWEDIEEGEAIAKAALYLVHDGSTLTEDHIPIEVEDKRTKKECVGELGHYPSKLKHYYELIAELPAEPILDRVLPSFLNDAELTDFIEELKELKYNIHAEELQKRRRVVVEHNVKQIGKSANKFPARIIPAEAFGGDFDKYEGLTLRHEEGQRDGVWVSYSQTYLYTKKSDEQLLREFN